MAKVTTDRGGVRELRLFVCTNFKGYWPVGTSAVIVHRNRIQAGNLLRAELQSKELIQEPDWEPKMKELKINEPGVYILSDGNY